VPFPSNSNPAAILGRRPCSTVSAKRLISVVASLASTIGRGVNVVPLSLPPSGLRVGSINGRRCSFGSFDRTGEVPIAFLFAGCSPLRVDV
jgi:hypothetical protein